jgi:hypothetical protein
MKWIVLFLTLSVAALLLAVFSTPVHVRIQPFTTFLQPSFALKDNLWKKQPAS